MKKPKTIELLVQTPCSENWHKMDLANEGKYCGRCRHTVIDFTGYSDTQLYQFFNTHQGEKICGRYRSSQLNRYITIVPQPHSRLYRLAIAAGLTFLALVPLNDAQARFKVPLATERCLVFDEEATDGDGTITIRGSVVDENHAPIKNVTIRLLKNGSLFTTAFTDHKGNFVFPPVSYMEWTEIDMDINAYNYIPATIKVDTKSRSFVYDIQLSLDATAQKYGNSEETIITGDTSFIQIEPPTNINGTDLHKR